MYAIQGKIKNAQEVLQRLEGKGEAILLQGRIRVAGKIAKSRGSAIVPLQESKAYAVLLDEIYREVKGGIKAKLRYVNGADIDIFYGLYAALNGEAFRVTAYENTHYTPTRYEKVIDGLLMA